MTIKERVRKLVAEEKRSGSPILAEATPPNRSRDTDGTAPRFQRLMERAVLIAGDWRHFAFWLLILIAWTAWGLHDGFTTKIQLWANTPTTWFELFLGLAILVGQLHQDRRTSEILARLDARSTTLLAEERAIEIKLDAIDTETLAAHLAARLRLLTTESAREDDLA